ncbi:MAG TPA: PKD domain-containing protein, partial [Gammaproteobacteria bacterium]|nr:PKD domain-containing protein [Gammaproteobacteria bacterium]
MMNHDSPWGTPTSTIELLRCYIRQVPAITTITLALYMLGGTGTAQAARFDCSINSVTPAAPVAGEVVTFEGAASGGGAPYNFTWDFGDGSVSVDTGVDDGETSSITHAYPAAGTYTVTMLVNGKLGSRKESTCKLQGKPPSVTVDVGSTGNNTPPTADANGPYTGTTGVGVNFSSTGSSDPDGNITSYAWSFGDGGTSTQANPGHTYTSAGDFNVTLTVTDNDGAS